MALTRTPRLTPDMPILVTGLSTDTKPTDSELRAGDLFYETDGSKAKSEYDGSGAVSGWRTLEVGGARRVNTTGVPSGDFVAITCTAGVMTRTDLGLFKDLFRVYVPVGVAGNLKFGDSTVTASATTGEPYPEAMEWATLTADMADVNGHIYVACWGIASGTIQASARA